MTYLDLYSVIDNPNAQIVIAGSGLGRIVGYIEDDIRISGSNDYSTPLDMQQMQNLQENVRLWGAAIETVISKIPRLQALTKDLNYSFQFAQQSTEMWTGSEKPIFSINLTFVSTKKGDDVRKIVSKLYRTVFPIGHLVNVPIKKGTSIQTMILTPPLNYKVSAEAQAISGTINVKVGQWFYATKQIMKRVDFKFSKEVLENGTPLYAQGSIEFMPFRQPSINEFLGYFPQVISSSGISDEEMANLVNSIRIE